MPEASHLQLVETTPAPQTSFAVTPAHYGIRVEDIEAARAKYAELSADTPAGYKLVRSAIAEIRTLRTSVEAKRKELKSGALEYGRKVDAVAKQLTALLEDIEAPLKLKKAAVDEERARQKREREEAERRALEEKIRAEREAEEARLRAEREAEEQRLAEERAALEAERARLEEERAQEEAARRAEQERIDAQRRAEEARLAAERRQLEEERRAIEEQRRQAETEEAERQARIRAEEEAKARADQERLEAEERARRLEAMRPDVEKVRAYGEHLVALAEDVPEVWSDEAQEALAWAVAELQRVSKGLRAFGSEERGGAG